MELLGIPLFDDDFYKMMIRFLLNLFFLTGIIKFVYYKRNPKKEYLFTFYLIGIVVYFLCFTLKKYELDLGMALGLFAIFGIIRYRTLPLEVKEMTYLFVVIGVASHDAYAHVPLLWQHYLAKWHKYLQVMHCFLILVAQM